MTAPEQAGSPRTDFVAFQLIWRNGAYYVSVPNIPTMEIVGADFARVLEEELAALAADRRALEYVLKYVGEFLHGTPIEHAMTAPNGDTLAQYISAALAAHGGKK